MIITQTTPYSALDAAVIAARTIIAFNMQHIRRLHSLQNHDLTELNMASVMHAGYTLIPYFPPQSGEDTEIAQGNNNPPLHVYADKAGTMLRSPRFINQYFPELGEFFNIVSAQGGLLDLQVSFDGQLLIHMETELNGGPQAVRTDLNKLTTHQKHPSMSIMCSRVKTTDMRARIDSLVMTASRSRSEPFISVIHLIRSNQLFSTADVTVTVFNAGHLHYRESTDSLVT